MGNESGKKSGSPWLWIIIAIVVLILLPIGGCVALCGGGIFMAGNAMVNNPIYKASIEKIKNDDHMKELLGENLEASIPSNIKINNTEAEVKYRVTGTKGSWEVLAKGVGSSIHKLTITFDDGTTETLIPETDNDHK